MSLLLFFSNGGSGGPILPDPANDIYLYEGRANPNDITLRDPTQVQGGVTPPVTTPSVGGGGGKQAKGRKSKADWAILEHPPKKAKPVKPLTKAAASLGIPKSTIKLVTPIDDDPDDMDIMMWAHNE